MNKIRIFLFFFLAFTLSKGSISAAFISSRGLHVRAGMSRRNAFPSWTEIMLDDHLRKNKPAAGEASQSIQLFDRTINIAPSQIQSFLSERFLSSELYKNLERDYPADFMKRVQDLKDRLDHKEFVNKNDQSQFKYFMERVNGSEKDNTERRQLYDEIHEIGDRIKRKEATVDDLRYYFNNKEKLFQSAADLFTGKKFYGLPFSRETRIEYLEHLEKAEIQEKGIREKEAQVQKERAKKAAEQGKDITVIDPLISDLDKTIKDFQREEKGTPELKAITIFDKTWQISDELLDHLMDLFGKMFLEEYSKMLEGIDVLDGDDSIQHVRKYLSEWEEVPDEIRESLENIKRLATSLEEHKKSVATKLAEIQGRIDQNSVTHDDFSYIADDLASEVDRMEDTRRGLSRDRQNAVDLINEHEIKQETDRIFGTRSRSQEGRQAGARSGTRGALDQRPQRPTRADQQGRIPAGTQEAEPSTGFITNPKFYGYAGGALMASGAAYAAYQVAHLDLKAGMIRNKLKNALDKRDRRLTEDADWYEQIKKQSVRSLLSENEVHYINQLETLDAERDQLHSWRSIGFGGAMVSLLLGQMFRKK